MCVTQNIVHALSLVTMQLQDSEQAVEWTAVNLYKPGEFSACPLPCHERTITTIARGAEPGRA